MNARKCLIQCDIFSIHHVLETYIFNQMIIVIFRLLPRHFVVGMVRSLCVLVAVCFLFVRLGCGQNVAAAQNLLRVLWFFAIRNEIEVNRRATKNLNENNWTK